MTLGPTPSLRWVLSCAAVLAHAQVASADEPAPVEIWRGNTMQTVSIGERDDASAERAEPATGVEVVRGLEVGPYASRFEINRYLFSGPERAQLRRDLAEIPNVFAEVLGVESGMELRRELERIDEDPSARARHRHARPIPAGRRARKERLRDRALHEASHAIVARRGAGAAFWIDEGLAKYFEQIETTAETTRIFVDAESERTLHAAARAGTLLDVDRLLSLSAAGPDDASLREIAAAQAWSMVYFLMRSESSAQILEQVLRDARDARGPEEIAASLGAHYPDGIPGFRRAWTLWRPSEKPAQVLFEPEPEESAPEPEPRGRRAIRCVPGTLAGDAVLFCSQIRRRGVATQIFRTGPAPAPPPSVSVSPR